MQRPLTWILMLSFASLTASCGPIDRFKEKSEKIEHYEETALELAKENRMLQVELGKAKYEIQSLKQRILYLEIQLGQKKKGKEVFVEEKKNGGEDSVKFDVYNWTPEELLTVAQKMFNEEKFLEASNYFDTYLVKYPQHKNVNDQIYFQAGVSSYKSNKFYQRAVKYLGLVLEKYPASPYFRGSKLWLALAQYKLGNPSFFYATVEEFRKKYRNTNEWQILSAYYEKFRHESLKVNQSH